MEYFESLAIPSSPTLIKWWFRYVDDVHSVIRKDQVNKTSRAPQFHRSTHQIHHRTPRNRWTPLPRYPDQNTPSSTEFIVYRRPTHTDRYLDYNFNHPISAKPSVINTLICKAKQVCSTPEFHAKEIDHLHKVLHHNHYPTQFF